MAGFFSRRHDDQPPVEQVNHGTVNHGWIYNYPDPVRRMPPDAKCQTCRFYKPNPGPMPGQVDRYGECREASPIQGSGSNLASWPIVHQTDWCGSWQQADEQEDKRDE